MFLRVLCGLLRLLLFDDQLTTESTEVHGELGPKKLWGSKEEDSVVLRVLCGLKRLLLFDDRLTTECTEVHGELGPKNW